MRRTSEIKVISEVLGNNSFFDTNALQGLVCQKVHAVQFDKQNLVTRLCTDTHPEFE